MDRKVGGYTGPKPPIPYGREYPAVQFMMHPGPYQSPPGCRRSRTSEEMTHIVQNKRSTIDKGLQ